ncbi:MAG TPA: IS66 family transposase [Chloroflexi bacterium]|nr:IS66 family transposase [Chloroflexota bacterium]
MSELPELPPLASHVRDQLPPEAQAYIWALEQQVVSLRAQVASFQAQVASQQEQIERLQAQVNKNSQNSSRPPSSDPPSAPPRPKRDKSGRKRGAQPGHEGQRRALVAESEVDAIHVHWPAHCPDCQAALPPAAAPGREARRQPVWDLPEVAPLVVAHRYEAVRCPGCERVVRAERPLEVAPGVLGARLTALVALLNGRYRLSQREVASRLEAGFGVPLSVGGVVGACEQVSAALERPSAEALAAVEQRACANGDETSWKPAGEKRWLGVAVTALFSVFVLARTRGAIVLQSLLGADYAGSIGSDRFSAYRTLPVTRRQLCWAHLKRDLLAIKQTSSASAAWGIQALEVVAQLFSLWHRFKQGELDRPTLQRLMQSQRETFARLLREGLALPAWTKAHALCTDLLKLEPALWTFLSVEGLEPTNNAAERALRPAVLWRTGSFGSNSESGLRFAERILTVAATCRQQQRPLLPFLSDAVHAHWAAQPAPSLLSTP